MPYTIDFVPFATAGGANVTAQATYITESTTGSGFMSGVASSADCNKAWRQATFQASVLANFVSNALNINVLDDGNLSTAITNLTSAVASFSTNASNLTTGTLASARLPATIGANTTGNAATATYATNAGTAANTPYSGLTGTVPTWNQNTTGNAATATYATNAGTAANTPYSGLTGAVPTWNQNTTGNAATATNATTAANVSISLNPGGPSDLVVATSGTTLGYVTGATVTAGGALSVSSINVTSDIDLKSNRRALTDAGAKLDRLDFELYEMDSIAGTHLGIPAQQLQQVQPEIVHPVHRAVVAEDGTKTSKFSHLSVNLYGATSLIGAALKETRADVQTQTDIIRSLIDRIAILEGRLAADQGEP